MTERKPPGTLVLVKWRDSCGPSRKWMDETYIKEEYTSLFCHTVGWVVRHDKKDLILCSSYGTEQIGDVSAIPAECVVKITRVK